LVLQFSVVNTIPEQKLLNVRVHAEPQVKREGGREGGTGRGMRGARGACNVAVSGSLEAMDPLGRG
jgi:hypothetical protein